MRCIFSRKLLVSSLLCVSTNLIVGNVSFVSAADSEVDKARAATVIQQNGQTEWRVGFTANWADTRIDQGLIEGSQVKTGRQSKLALIFRDDSQMRLNQNSLLIVKDVLDEAGSSTRFRLNQGRAWVRSKNIPDQLVMETPTAVAAIRGTDWDIEVAEEGKSTITVIHGSVYFSNEFGAVTVNANEQAIAEQGKAPVKIVISNPRDRIQWVTEYQHDPEKYQHLKADAQQAHQVALQADQMLYHGEYRSAIRHIELYPDYQDYPELVTLRGKAHLMGGTAVSLDNPTNHHGIQLHNADIAIFNGDAKLAIKLLSQVIEREPENQEAWYKLGKVYTELHDISLSEIMLNEAIRLNSNDPKAYAEKATLYTFTNEFDKAEKAYDSADSHHANQALTLTGRGIMALKQGQLEIALKHLLKAGTLEPQMARIQTFLAIVYFEMGDVELAKETLKWSMEIDDKDPLPYFLYSSIERDQYKPKAGLDASRQAVERLPYLKSLNQVANNFQGSANLGSALADFGMSDWALKYAVDSYDPFWAGSQLFLSHRFDQERFLQRSELFKGIVNDPMVFGASNRGTDLVLQPGLFTNARWRFSENWGLHNGNKHQTYQRWPSITVNGFSNSFLPVSYFLEKGNYGQETHTENDAIVFDLETKPKFERIGVGMKLSTKVSVFGFRNQGETGSRIDSDPEAENQVTLDDSQDLQDDYFGVKYKINPTSDLNFSYFGFETNVLQDVEISNTNELINGDFISRSEFISNNSTHYPSKFLSKQLNWRFLNSGNHFFEIGYSQDDQNSSVINEQSLYTSSINIFQGEVLSETEFSNETGFDDYEKVKLNNSYFHWQTNKQMDSYFDLLLEYTETDAMVDMTGRTALDPPRVITKESHSNWAYGIGLKSGINDEWVVRTSYHDWETSGSIVTTGPTTLGGIPFSTVYTKPGADNKRGVVQLELEKENLFFKITYEHIKVDIPVYSERISAETTEVYNSELRQLSVINNDVTNIFDFDRALYGSTNDFIGKGTVENTTLTLNTFFTERFVGNFEFTYTDSEHTVVVDEVEDKYFMPSQTRTRSRLGLLYSTSFHATPFIQGTYFHFPSFESTGLDARIVDSGWFWNVGWRQEFLDKKLLVTAQRIVRDLENSDLWNVVFEYRFY